MLNHSPHPTAPNWSWNLCFCPSGQNPDAHDFLRLISQTYFITFYTRFFFFFSLCTFRWQNILSICISVFPLAEDPICSSHKAQHCYCSISCESPLKACSLPPLSVLNSGKLPGFPHPTTDHEGLGWGKGRPHDIS